MPDFRIASLSVPLPLRLPSCGLWLDDLECGLALRADKRDQSARFQSPKGLGTIVAAACWEVNVEVLHIKATMTLIHLAAWVSVKRESPQVA
jgi:hypothetical protein